MSQEDFLHTIRMITEQLIQQQLWDEAATFIS